MQPHVYRPIQYTHTRTHFAQLFPLNSIPLAILASINIFNSHKNVNTEAFQNTIESDICGVQLCVYCTPLEPNRKLVHCSVSKPTILKALPQDRQKSICQWYRKVRLDPFTQLTPEHTVRSLWCLSSRSFPQNRCHGCISVQLSLILVRVLDEAWLNSM